MIPFVLKNYCEILGVGPDATHETLFEAYCNALEVYNPNNPDVASTFNQNELNNLRRMIEDAFAILSNESISDVYKNKNGSATDLSPTPSATPAREDTYHHPKPQKVVLNLIIKLNAPNDVRLQ